MSGVVEEGLVLEACNRETAGLGGPKEILLSLNSYHSTV